MRGKILIALCSLLVGVVGTLVFTGGAAKVAAECPGAPGKPCGPGDVNADGEIDIGDAIYMS